MTFNSELIRRKARKHHQRSWCGTRIESGATYLRRFCVHEGSGGTIKQHPECHVAESLYYELTQENEWDCGIFTRGCICEGGDSRHGTYEDCKNVAEALTPAPGKD